MSDPGDYRGWRNPASPYPDFLPDEGLYGERSAADKPGPLRPEPRPMGDGSQLDPDFRNGVNLQPSYGDERGDYDLGWHLMRQLPPIKTVRIEIEEWAVPHATRWISEAAQHGYRVIATYHSFAALQDYQRAAQEKAKNESIAAINATHMQRAISFWTSHYPTLAAAGPFVLNIMNEWGDKTISATDYADHYNRAIAAIRAFYAGPIVIDLPGYGQNTRTAIQAVMGSETVSKIQDTNIMLSAHVYPPADNGGRPMVPNDLNALAATGRRCLIGEFGAYTDEKGSAEGQTDWRAVVTRARSLGWPVLAWAWNGDGGKMNMVRPAFQKFVPGKPNLNYRLDASYAAEMLRLIR